METFFDPLTRAPITHIAMAEGDTKVVSIKNVKLGPPDGVIVCTNQSQVATCHPVAKLNKPKNDLDGNYNMLSVAQQTSPVEIGNTIYFQVSGMGAGSTTLQANFFNNNNQYASPIPIIVSGKHKSLGLGVSFDTLWRAHPYNNPEPFERQSGFQFQICSQEHNSCMIRFCTTLKRGGVHLAGLPERFKCGKPGAEHAHHFTWPYDFEAWRGVKDAFVWEAKAPYQPEPMPGYAAYYFVLGKRGVILFRDYFPIKTYNKQFPAGRPESGTHGGHIDLWNKIEMGNDIQSVNMGVLPMKLDSAFLRARKIVFWPLG